MSLSFRIAIRYIFATKSHTLINSISIIAVVGIMVGTASLIILLSTFNGLEEWIVKSNNLLDPSLKVATIKGKHLALDSNQIQQIQQIKEITSIQKVYEENALLNYLDRQYIVTLKGVELNYLSTVDLDTCLQAGDLLLQKDSIPYAIVGIGVAQQLLLNLADDINPLTIYAPQKDATTINPEEAFNTAQVLPSSIISVQPDFDSKYVIVPMQLMHELYQNDVITYLEIKIKDKENIPIVQNKIQKIGHNTLKIQDAYQQHEMLYKIVLFEKIAVYLLLTFILLIAMFNLLGIITILIIDKDKEIKILHFLGMKTKTIQKIFFWQGFTISIVGGVIGLVLGGIICYLQQQYHLVNITEEEAYPIKMTIKDFVMITSTVGIIGWIGAVFASKKVFNA